MIKDENSKPTLSHKEEVKQISTKSFLDPLSLTTSQLFEDYSDK